MNRNKLLMICVAAFMLIAAGTVVLSSYSTVTRSAVTFDQTLIVPGGNYGSKLFDVFRNYDYIVSFTVLNGSLRSCFPLAEGYFDQWQNGEYEPNWGDETSHAEYQIRRSGSMPGTPGAILLYFFVFNNEDLSSKEVRVQATRYWNEIDPVNASIAMVAIIAGVTLSAWTLLKLKRPKRIAC